MVFSPSEMLQKYLECMRGGCTGACASVMVLVVSTLFPQFCYLPCLSEGGGKSPFTSSAGSREAPSALPKGRTKGARALALLLASAEQHPAEEISCCRVQELEKMLQEEWEAMLGTAFYRAVAWH